MDKKIKVNAEQKVYVIPHGNYYTCLGFEVAERRAIAAAKFAGLEKNRYTIGTLEAYQEYARIMRLAEDFSFRTGGKCDIELTKQLKGLEGKRVEVVTTYDEKRRFYVGKSTGWMPCHLEIARPTSISGPAAEKEYKSVRIVRKTF